MQYDKDLESEHKELNKNVVEYYIKQAIEINSKK